jgi:GEVED domain/Secretion system C-terminal sorting domain
MNTFFKSLLLIILSLHFTLLAVANNGKKIFAPCMPIYTIGCSNGDFIDYFSLKGESSTVIYNNSGSSCTLSPVAYSDFTTTFSAVSLAKGNTYSGFLRSGNPNDYVTIWIDANDNDLFEDAERIMNNLKISTTNTLYGIYIPQSMASGVHRLRVRAINNTIRPTTLTTPCGSYTYGEAEDYLVNITTSATTRLVSPGTELTCSQGSLITLDTASNNVLIGGTNYVHILDSSNNYIIGINTNGASWGTTDIKLYINPTSYPIRPDAGGNKYIIDRHFFLRNELNTNSAYSLKYYYKTSELNRIIAQSGSGVTSQFDLDVRLQRSPIASLGETLCVTGPSYSPVSYGNQGADKYLIIQGLEKYFAFFLVNTGNIEPYCYADIVNNWSFYANWGPGSSVCQSLPYTTLAIQLLSFTGNHLSNNTNKLNWVSASEQNNKGFAIQRSSDGTNWKDIGFVPSNTTNSSSNQYYSYIDNALENKVNYYRLKQIDNDNNYKLTAVIKLQSNKTEEGISIYPNPVNDEAAVTIKTNTANTKVQCSIIDMFGRLVSTQNISITAGITVISINLRAFAKGYYIFSVNSSTINEHYKFIKN